MPLLNPGSPEAQREGCTCDARINRDGKGAGVTHGGQTIFVEHPRCGLHGDEKARERHQKRLAKQGRS